MNRGRYLRRNATDCERILWRRLRNRNFANYKFRRQHPIDRYTLDFYCPEAHLAIELDGGGHERMRHQIHDRERTEFLASQEILVLRFWNHQVREELDSVLQAIWFVLEQRCPKNPSHLNPLPLRKAEAGSNYCQARDALRPAVSPPLPDYGERIEVRGYGVVTRAISLPAGEASQMLKSVL